MATSSWQRWVNCARHVTEQNVECHQCYGKVLYRTTRDVHPGEELLVFYGEEYARWLDINVDMYYNSSVDVHLYKQYPCWNL